MFRIIFCFAFLVLPLVSNIQKEEWRTEFLKGLISQIALDWERMLSANLICKEMHKVRCLQIDGICASQAEFEYPHHGSQSQGEIY